MKYDLTKANLDYDLKWLKEPNNILNDYSDVIRHLLNEVEELKQLSIQRVVLQSEQLKPNQQICYKSNKPCKYDCSGLCKESC